MEEKVGRNFAAQRGRGKTPSSFLPSPSLPPLRLRSTRDHFERVHSVIIGGRLTRFLASLSSISSPHSPQFSLERGKERERERERDVTWWKRRQGDLTRAKNKGDTPRRASVSFFRATTLVSKSYWRACFFVARVPALQARSRGIFELCNYACFIYIFSLLLFIKSNASFSKQKYKRFECVLESFRFAIRKFEGIVQLCGGNYFVFLGVIFIYIYKGMVSNIFYRQ